MDAAALIISGGSRGLGLAMTGHYLRQGHRVATFARSKTAAVEELEKEFTGRFFFQSLEATDPAKVESFVQQVVSRFGSIYGLVNNAAIGQDHLLAHMPLEAIDALLAVNLRAPILLTQAVLRRMMLNANGGRIVNISSICASRGYAALSVYAATKGGLEAFTRSLARELGGRNILVNALAPGFFPSAMSSSLAAQQLETIRRRTPTERLCQEEDLLPLLDLLLLGQVNITGQSFGVDGGASL